MSGDQEKRVRVSGYVFRTNHPERYRIGQSQNGWTVVAMAGEFVTWAFDWQVCS